MKCRAAVVSFCSLAVLLVCVASARADDITIDLKSFKFSPPKGTPDTLFGYNEDVGKLFFNTNGPAEAPFKAPADGDYEIVISASGDSVTNSGDAKVDGPPKFTVAVDGTPVGAETALTGDDVKDYKLPVTLKTGDHKLVITFTNDVYKEGAYDRNFYVNGVKISPKK